MAKVTLDDISSGYAATNKINTNNATLEDELNNKVLYRDNPDGEPNQMENILDMNSNRVINVANGINNSDAVNYSQLNGAIAAASSGLIAMQRETQKGSEASGQVFTATGVSFTAPGSNLLVNQNGNTLYNGRDYTVGNNTITVDSGITINPTDDWDFYVNVATTNSTTDTAAITHSEDSTSYNLATYLQNRHIVNALDFGLVAGGTASTNVTALQNAINTGSPVYIPAGNYSFDSSVFGVDGMRIFGAGPDKTILTYTYEQQAGDDDVGAVKASGDSPGAGSVSFITTLDGHDNITVEDMQLVYTGTFDTGSSYSGKIAGLRIGSCTNLTVRNVTGTGWNHSTIHLQPHTTYSAVVDNVSRNILIENCYFYQNRVSGFWYTHCDNVRIINNTFEENGLSTDIGTGYGCATSGYGDFGRPSNVLVEGNWFNNNKYTGCDFHRANEAIMVVNNRFTGDTDEGGDYGQIRHLYILNMQGGSIKVIGNDFDVLRRRTNSTFALTTAIDIKHELAFTASLLAPLSVLIDGNTFRNIDVDGAGTQDCQIITFSNQTHPALYTTISNNHFEVTEADYFIFGGSPTIDETYEFGQINIENNIFNADLINALPVQVGNLSQATITTNIMNVTSCLSDPFTGAYTLYTGDSGLTLNGNVTVIGNETEITDKPDRWGYFSSYHTAYGNSYNGYKEPDRDFYTADASTYHSVAKTVSAGNKPVGVYVESGSMVTYTNTASGSSPGAYCTTQYNKTATPQSLSGSSTLTVNSGSALAQTGDPISIELANGNRHITTIAAGATSTSITLTDPLPADTRVGNFGVYINVYKALANIS